MHSLVFSGDLREYLASTARFIFFLVLGDKGHGGWGLGSKVKAQIWKVAQSKVKRIEDQRIRGRVPG